MAIKLRVISDQYRDLGENRVRIFGVNGGSIGRAPDNDWVLPDMKRLVSGHHCDIEYRGGGFWLSDRSTNGVYVNEADDPVSDTGPVALQDGDRLRLGDYEILVSLDDQNDFLPGASELHSAEKHLDAGLGANIDLDSLFAPRENGVEDSSQDIGSNSMSVRNAFGIKISKSARRDEDGSRPNRTLLPPGTPPDEPPPPPAGSPPAEWAMKTTAVSRQELADALARRQQRIEARQQTLPFHQQASTWTDLKSAVQAFCRGAGLDPTALSPEAQSMLPLVAGQLLREVVVGLADVQLARGTAGPATPQASATLAGSNPLRGSTDTGQALTRLFESHGRTVGGPVEALRDVLLETKEHEAAVAAGVRAGLEALLGQLAPSNIADQFEQGRARTLAPGQDPRPRYWEHYGELFRVIVQNGTDGIPHPYVEAYAKAYEAARAEHSARRSGRTDD